jgi:ABC-type phosphate transport system substrate-binding protein
MNRRSSFLLLSAIISLAMILAPAARAADIKIIANASVQVTAISMDELRAVFLATKTSLQDGTHVEPVLAKGGPVHDTFLKEYLGKTDAALQTYYRSLVFTGKGSMPKVFPSDAEVVAYVAKTKGAVAYVGSGAATAGVKTLEVR